MAMVSIIVPYYKGQVYLKECIQSIVEQKYEDYEIISHATQFYKSKL